MPALPRKGWPSATHGKTRNPSVPVIATIYVRDRFTCLYCGRWTIPTQLLRLVSHAFPPSSLITRTGRWKSRRARTGTSRRASTTSTPCPWAATTRIRAILRPCARGANTGNAVSRLRLSAGPSVVSWPVGRGSSTSTRPCGSGLGARILASTLRGSGHSMPRDQPHRSHLQPSNPIVHHAHDAFPGEDLVS
jgi:hypothetical protein